MSDAPATATPAVSALKLAGQPAEPVIPPAPESFAAYVHIPFCATRCGYCDFNTYTNLHFSGGAAASRFAQTIMREITLSAERLGIAGAQRPRLSSVFFGGGTPTMLPARDLVAILAQLQATFGIQPGAEITTEANPESVNAPKLAELKAGGFTRVSFGMQSAVPQVLATLERRHTPGQVAAVTQQARELGLDYSLDLIYGTPGESMADWERSVQAAIALAPAHISAYALTLEPHVPLARRIARGELGPIDADDQADKYERADELLSAAGYQWYEISNWAQPGHESRHNVTYWHDGNWWGYGPGAHSHISGTRWWNVKHPIAYAQALGASDVPLEIASHGTSQHGVNSDANSGANSGSPLLAAYADTAGVGQLPVADSEVLTRAEIREEQILLGIRLREGIPVPPGVTRQTVQQLVADGLITLAPAPSRDTLPSVAPGTLANDLRDSTPSVGPSGQPGDGPRGQLGDAPRSQPSVGPSGQLGDSPITQSNVQPDARERIVLTRRGRLLADIVTRALF